MKIMSFNLLYKNTKHRKAAVLELINRHSPDTLGVQEAHILWIKALKKGLAGYDYVGVGRDNGKRKGEFSAVFFKKDRFELLDSGSFWLSETPEKPGKGWDAACVRICSWAKLKDKRSGKEFVHLNTHLDHVGRIAMQKGAELIARQGNEISGGCAAFFTGDFNVTPGSEPYNAVIKGGFSDCRAIAETSCEKSTFHGYKDYDDIIDYIFCLGNVKVKSFAVIDEKIDGSYPSDHHPVMAEVEI